MALSIAEITIELREILLNDRPQRLYEISPKGTVPVLQTNEKVIEESIEIIFWAMKKLSHFDDYFHDFSEQEEIIDNNDSEFKKWLDRYKYNERYTELTLEDCKKKTGEIISDYERRLSKFKFLIKDSIQITDIAIFPFIRQFANVDMEYFVNTYPNTNLWLEKILNSNLFKFVMKKYPPWHVEDFPKIINFGSEPIEA